MSRAAEIYTVATPPRVRRVHGTHLFTFRPDNKYDRNAFAREKKGGRNIYNRERERE